LIEVKLMKIKRLMKMQGKAKGKRLLQKFGREGVEMEVEGVHLWWIIEGGWELDWILNER
jgi:hypothetical protein